MVETKCQSWGVNQHHGPKAEQRLKSEARGEQNLKLKQAVGGTRAGSETRPEQDGNQAEARAGTGSRLEHGAINRSRHRTSTAAGMICV